jgi:hypothetical protein
LFNSFILVKKGNSQVNKKHRIMEAKDNKSETSNSNSNFSTIWLKLGEHKYELPMHAQPNNNGFTISIHPNTHSNTFPQNPITTLNEIHSPHRVTLGEHSKTQPTPTLIIEEPKDLHKKKPKKHSGSANEQKRPSQTLTKIQAKLTSFMGFQYVGEDPELKKLYSDRWDAGEIFDLNEKSNNDPDIDLVYPVILNSQKEPVELGNSQPTSGLEGDPKVQSLKKKSALKKKKKTGKGVTKIKTSGKVVCKEAGDAINAIQEVHDVINGMMCAYEQSQKVLEAEEKSSARESPEQQQPNSAKKSAQKIDYIDTEKLRSQSKKNSLVDVPKMPKNHKGSKSDADSVRYESVINFVSTEGGIANQEKLQKVSEIARDPELIKAFEKYFQNTFESNNKAQKFTGTFFEIPEGALVNASPKREQIDQDLPKSPKRPKRVKKNRSGSESTKKLDSITDSIARKEVLPDCDQQFINKKSQIRNFYIGERGKLVNVERSPNSSNVNNPLNFDEITTANFKPEKSKNKKLKKVGRRPEPKPNPEPPKKQRESSKKQRESSKKRTRKSKAGTANQECPETLEEFETGKSLKAKRGSPKGCSATQPIDFTRESWNNSEARNDTISYDKKPPPHPKSPDPVHPRSPNYQDPRINEGSLREVSDMVKKLSEEYGLNFEDLQQKRSTDCKRRAEKTENLEYYQTGDSKPKKVSKSVKRKKSGMGSLDEKGSDSKKSKQKSLTNWGRKYDGFTPRPEGDVSAKDSLVETRQYFNKKTKARNGLMGAESDRTNDISPRIVPTLAMDLNSKIRNSSLKPKSKKKNKSESKDNASQFFSKTSPIALSALLQVIFFPYK